MKPPPLQLPRVLQTLTVLQRTLLTVTCVLSALVVGLAWGWQQAVRHELAYFVAPDSTQACYKRPSRIHRAAFELENFTQQFLQDALAHNEFTYQANLQRALQVMDQPGRALLQSKFDEEAIFEVYTQYNGLSTVSAARIVVNQQDYPYTVQAYYTIQMHFIGLDETACQPQKTVQGGVSFQLHTTQRSAHNPYGLIISQFHFIPYEPA